LKEAAGAEFKGIGNRWPQPTMKPWGCQARQVVKLAAV